MMTHTNESKRQLWAVMLAWMFSGTGGSLPGEDADFDFQAFMEQYPFTRFYCLPRDHENFHKQESQHRPGRVFVPGLLASFDWKYTGVLDERRAQDPQTVFTTPDRLDHVLNDAVWNFDGSHANRVIVFGGSDTLLSVAFGRTEMARRQTVLRLQTYFRAIFYEAKDVALDGVMTMPIGLTEHYLREGVAARAAQAITGAGIDSVAKPGIALAAWGAVTSNLENPSACANKPKLRIACNSRSQLRSWVQTKAASEARIEHREIDTQHWWGELSKYRFLLAPAGAGVQSPKVLEALLVLTVPIVERRDGVTAWDDLLQLGFPIVVVDEWSDITSAALARWWNDLSPRLASFRQHNLTSAGYIRIFKNALDPQAHDEL